MKFASTAMASTGTLFTLVQQTGALANVIIPISSSSIPGTVVSKVINSDNDPFANFPQPATRLCESELEGTTVTFSSKPQNGVRVDGVPTACMTLADVFLGQGPQQPAAIPVGVFSLEYHNLSEDQLGRLYDVFDRRYQAQGL